MSGLTQFVVRSIVPLLLCCFCLQAAWAAEGLLWLQAQKQTSGAYVASNDLVGPNHNTAEALLTLQLFDSLSAQAAHESLTFLEMNPVDTLVAQAQLALLYSVLAQDPSAILTQLKTQQNSDGGFGDQDSFGSTVYDTAWALKAFAIQAQAQASVGAAIFYLQAQQQNNGAWRLGDNEDSVYLTALVIEALSSFKELYSGVPSLLDKAIEFLLSRQDGNELWSETFVSSQVLLALVQAGEGTRLLNPISQALQASQQVDGSWEQDVLSTALALRALEQVVQSNTVKELQLTGAIGGTAVRFGSEVPLAGVTVTVLERPNRQVTTDANGFFLLQDLPAGRYTLQASRSSFVPVSREIEVISGKTILAGHWVLARQLLSGVLQGTLFDAQTLMPLNAATVNLRKGTLQYNALTSITGTFSLTSLEPGDYNVTLSKSGYEPIVSSVSISAGERLLLNHALLALGTVDTSEVGTITATVLDNMTAEPIVGASLRLNDNLIGVSDSQGNLVVDAVPRGYYQGVLQAPGFVDQAVTVLFPVGASGHLGGIRLMPNAGSAAPTQVTITGQVKQALSGVGIAGATVTVLETQQSVMTDAAGAFVLADIDHIQFTLAVSSPNFEFTEFSVVLERFGSVQMVLSLTPEGQGGASSTQITGTITAADTGLPLANAKVELAPLNISVLTDAQGHYQLPEITSLDFSVTISAVGYLMQERLFHLTEHGSFIFDLALELYEPEVFQILELKPSQPGWTGNETAQIDAQVKNISNQAQTALLVGHVYNTAGQKVASFSTDTHEESFASGESKTISLSWYTSQLTPGRYQMVLQVTDLVGKVKAEADTYLQIMPLAQASGFVGASPAVTRLGLAEPVVLRAGLHNTGNIALPNAQYQLIVRQVDSGDIVLERTVEAPSLGVNQQVDLEFGSWQPTVAGSLILQVSPLTPGVKAYFSGKLEVGEKISDVFTIERSMVAPGSHTLVAQIDLRTILASIAFNRIDPTDVETRFEGLELSVQLTFAKDVLLESFSLMPSSKTILSSGATVYSWHLNELSLQQDPINFLLNIENLQSSQTIAVAEEAMVMITDTLAEQVLEMPLKVPVVSVVDEIRLLSINTDKSNYGALSAVSIETKLSNMGPAFSTGRVDFSLQPLGLEAVPIVLASVPISDLNAGADSVLTIQWNTGTSLVGYYQLNAQLFDAQGQSINTQSTKFSIVAPQISIAAQINADQSEYEAWDTVHLNARVHNLSKNTALSAVLLQVEVVASGGSSLFSEQKDLGVLTPDTIDDHFFSVHLVDANSGDYQAKVTIKDSVRDIVLATAVETFRVERNLLQGLQGSVTVSSSEVIAGQDILCTESITNLSEQAALGVFRSFQLVKMDTMSVLRSVTESLEPISGGSVQMNMRSIDTTGLGAGEYACILSVGTDNQQQVLGYAVFKVAQAPLQMSTTLELNAATRLLVLADPVQDSCSATQQMTFSADLPEVLQAHSALVVKVFDHKGRRVDKHKVRLSEFSDRVRDFGEAKHRRPYLDVEITELVADAVTFTVTARKHKDGDLRAFNQPFKVSAFYYGSEQKWVLNSGWLSAPCGSPLETPSIRDDFVLENSETVELLVQTHHQFKRVENPDRTEQRVYLQTLLQEAGIEYALVDSKEAFREAFYSGYYNQYLLVNERIRLHKTTAKALREAVHRGNGLIVAGGRVPSRHAVLETLGLDASYYHKKHNRKTFRKALAFKAQSLMLEESILHPIAEVTLGRIDKLRHIRAGRAEVLGTFMDAERVGRCDWRCRQLGYDQEDVLEDLAALTFNHYGQGKAVYVAFDLLAEATLAQQSGSHFIYQDVLINSLRATQPDEINTRLGGPVAVTVTVKNQGTAAIGQTLITLPMGSRILDSGPAQIISDSELSVAYQLESAEQMRFTLWFALDYSDGLANLTALTQGGVTESELEVLDFSTLSVFETDIESLEDVLERLQLVKSESRRLKWAYHKLRKAVHFIEKDRDQLAFALMLKATDFLRKAEHLDAKAIRLNIDWILWELAQTKVSVK